MLRSVLPLLVGLLVLGVFGFLVDRYVPMIDIVRTTFRIVIVVIVILWLIQFLAVLVPGMHPIL